MIRDLQCKASKLFFNQITLKLQTKGLIGHGIEGEA